MRTFRLSINPPAKGFGGKDSVKGNRQGSLSRWIKQLFETLLKFQKVHQRVEKAFFDTLNSRPARLFFVVQKRDSAEARRFPVPAPPQVYSQKIDFPSTCQPTGNTV